MVNADTETAWLNTIEKSFVRLWYTMHLESLRQNNGSFFFIWKKKIWKWIMDRQNGEKIGRNVSWEENTKRCKKKRNNQFVCYLEMKAMVVDLCGLCIWLLHNQLPCSKLSTTQKVPDRVIIIFLISHCLHNCYYCLTCAWHSNAWSCFESKVLEIENRERFSSQLRRDVNYSHKNVKSANGK